ncbi:MAG TPA: YjfB family protein [Azospira sp.]|nr:YjfB family protein [Azospira sp.]
MDITGIASMATQFSDAKTADQIQVAVLKKAMDAQAQSAQQLIEALPQPSSVNLPEHLGKNVNTTA